MKLYRVLFKCRQQVRVATEGGMDSDFSHYEVVERERRIVMEEWMSGREAILAAYCDQSKHDPEYKLLLIEELCDVHTIIRAESRI